MQPMCVSVMPLNGGNRNKGCNRSFGIVDNVPKSQIPNPKLPPMQTCLCHHLTQRRHFGFGI